MYDLQHFLAGLHFGEISDHHYNNAQIGAQIQIAKQDSFDIDGDIVLLGCGEMRGHNDDREMSNAPNAIREELYKMFQWHNTFKVTDIGNLLQGATVEDTRAALTEVLVELQQAGKTVILLGGSHDLTLQQYTAFKRAEQIINVVNIDMLIDLEETETVTDKGFLLELLTAQPNFIRHYTHLGFQSYYVPPRMLETLDKLRFDCFRLGKIREHMEEAEPALRAANLLSFDIKAIRHSDAPSNIDGSPNGFSGDEACLLMRYAGMSPDMQSVGIYGYHESHDKSKMTAKQIAQMIWYFIDGYSVRQKEAPLEQRENFKEFHLRFTSNDVLFLKSKKTNRWWMQLPDASFIPCTYQDYVTAREDEIPERWLREQERLV